MYSDANILQEFKNQTKGLIPAPMLPSSASNPNPHQPQHQQQQNPASVSSTIQSLNYLQQLKPTANQVPRGVNSLSMNMLNLGIHDAMTSGGFFFLYKNTLFINIFSKSELVKGRGGEVNCKYIRDLN